MPDAPDFPKRVRHDALPRHVKNSIVVVGSVALDSVKTPHGESREALGGSAVYFSLAARLFSPVSVVGVVGEDFPASYREMLSSRDVNLDGLRVVPGRTFRWVGKYGRDTSDAKTVETQLNVFETFRPDLTPAQRRAPVVFLANIDPELQAEVLAQMHGPHVVACDTMNFWISSKKPALKELLSRAHIFFVNDAEARRLSRRSDVMGAAAEIQRWGPKIVVVKKGEHGALMRVRDRCYAFPAYPVEEVKDPTGAGDTFAGAFMGTLASSGRSLSVEALKRALLYGTTAASFKISEFGTRAMEVLDRPALDRRFGDFLSLLQVSPNGSATPVGP